jgi:hypothetical protein
MEEAAQIKTECAKVCQTITDPDLRAQVERSYDEKLHKKYAELEKL